MPIKIQNANEAGFMQRAVTTAQYILDLLEQIETEAHALETLHWYGELPDIQDARDTLRNDVNDHQAELGRWNGNIATQPAPMISETNKIDLTDFHKIQTYIGS